MPSKLFRGQGNDSDRDDACRKALESAIYQAARHMQPRTQYRLTIGNAWAPMPAEGSKLYYGECEVTLREEVEASNEDARAVAREGILQKAFREVKLTIETAEKQIDTHRIKEKE